MFISQAFGFHLGISQQIAVAAASVMAGIGIAGVPEAGLITLPLAISLHRTELRVWLRKLGWWALGIVIVQGLIGGTRVTLDGLHVPGFEMSLGQMLRIPHGVLAQVYVCVLFAIAAGTSMVRAWRR